MPLPDENPGVVDGLGHTRFEHLGLKTPLQEVLNSQSKNIIELVLALFQKPIPVHPSQKSLTLKDTARVLLIQGKKFPGSITDTAQSILNPPQLPLAPKPVLSNKLQLSIQTFLLIRTSWLLESLSI